MSPKSHHSSKVTSTIRDVAVAAGVSITTVSHVLNKTRYVSDELKERVVRAMDELGYQPNVLARGLRSGQTKTIGLVVPDMSNLFFAEISRAVEDILFKEGYSLIICNSDDNPEKQNAYLGVLVAKQVEGIIFISTSFSEDFPGRLENTDIPIVFADREIPSTLIDVVLIDNEYGGFLATDYLINLGYNRIACITGPSELTPSADRVNGYYHALDEANLPRRPEYIIAGDFHYHSGEKAMLHLLGLDPKPDAVFVSNDMMAFGSIRAIRSCNLRVPDDISIVGFDDILLAQASSPALTTIAQPIQKMAENIVELLFVRMQATKLPLEPRRIILKPELVIRDSCMEYRKNVNIEHETQYVNH